MTTQNNNNNNTNKLMSEIEMGHTKNEGFSIFFGCCLFRTSRTSIQIEFAVEFV